MKVRITDELAQQIVDSAKAVVGWNVNFIDRHGRIMASTDSARIGTYHKAGHVAARTGRVQTVQEDRPEEGVSQGVNYPGGCRDYRGTGCRRPVRFLADENL